MPSGCARVARQARSMSWRSAASPVQRSAPSEMYHALKKRGSVAFQRSPNGDLVKGFPLQLVQAPLQITRNSPQVGEHTEQFVG